MKRKGIYILAGVSLAAVLLPALSQVGAPNRPLVLCLGPNGFTAERPSEVRAAQGRDVLFGATSACTSVALLLCGSVVACTYCVMLKDAVQLYAAEPRNIRTAGMGFDSSSWTVSMFDCSVWVAGDS
jgi:hypothetical protein